MALLAPPEDLQMNGNLEEAWPLFKQRFLLYLKATGASQWPSSQKVALFLTVAGPEALKLYNSFQLDPKEEEDFEAVVAHFEDHCRPHRKEVYERFLFRTRLQEPHESLEDFVADLHHKSRFCNFGSQRELLVRDQIVLGYRDCCARQQLLQQDELTLQEALEICRTAEATVKDAQLCKDSLKQSEARAAAKRTRFQVANVRDSNTLPSRQRLRRVRSMVNKTDSCRQTPQLCDNCLRKESFKTYV